MIDWLTRLSEQTAVINLLIGFDALLLFSLLVLLLDLLSEALCRLAGLRHHGMIPVRVAVVTAGAGLLFSSRLSEVVKTMLQPVFGLLYRTNEQYSLVMGGLALLWVCGAAASVLRYLRRHAAFARSLRIAVPTADSALCDAMELAGVHAVDCRELPGISSPGLYGLRRPTVVIPVGFTERTSYEDRLMIYLHELSHARGGDLALHTVLQLLCRLLYLHPPLKTQLLRLLQYRELCCDRQALALYGDPGEYAALILRQLRKPLAPCPSFANGSYREMRTRISALFQRRQLPLKAAALYAALVIFIFSFCNLALPDLREPTGDYALLVLYQPDFPDVIFLDAVEEAAPMAGQLDGYDELALMEVHFLWSGLLGAYTVADIVEFS